MSTTLPTFNVGPPPPQTDPRFWEWITQFWKWTMIYSSNTSALVAALPMIEGAGIILETTSSGTTISAEVTSEDFAQFIANQKTMNELLFKIYTSMRELQEQAIQEQ